MRAECLLCIYVYSTLKSICDVIKKVAVHLRRLSQCPGMLDNLVSLNTNKTWVLLLLYPYQALFVVLLYKSIICLSLYKINKPILPRTYTMLFCSLYESSMLLIYRI